MSSLVTVRFESSITPPFSYDVGDDGTDGGTPDTGVSCSFCTRARLFILGLVRPRATLSSDLLGTKEYAPWGRPFPWQIGLVLVLLGVAYLGHLLWVLARRARREVSP